MCNISRLFLWAAISNLLCTANAGEVISTADLVRLAFPEYAFYRQKAIAATFVSMTPAQRGLFLSYPNPIAEPGEDEAFEIVEPVDGFPQRIVQMILMNWWAFKNDLRDSLARDIVQSSFVWRLLPDFDVFPGAKMLLSNWPSHRFLLSFTDIDFSTDVPAQVSTAFKNLYYSQDLVFQNT